MPVIKDRSKNYGDRDKGNRVKNWLTKKQNFNKTYKIGKKGIPSFWSGLLFQPIYSDIFLCSSDWSGTHCELELSHSNLLPLPIELWDWACTMLSCSWPFLDPLKIPAVPSQVCQSLGHSVLDLTLQPVYVPNSLGTDPKQHSLSQY